MPRRRRWALLPAVLACALLSGCFLDGGDPVSVQVEGGELRGVARDDVRAYRGIPYAAPPVGDLRWRPPAPAADWEGERDAEEFADSCPQPGAEGGLAEGTSEDCLYLNVWRPDTETDDLPVMVWLHGGGLTLGNGDLTDEIVRGTVADGVVVVSLNYRLGRLGYLAHPALAAEQEADGEEQVANFGLLDQVAALEWVQENIEQFGGDPEQVTVFGISAGGASVNFLMSSPRAEGLFARAVTGSGLGNEVPPTYDAAAAEGAAVVGGLPGGDTDDAAALRELDVDDLALLPTYQLANQAPILDSVLPASVSDTFAAGDEAPVPWIVGTTDRELLDPSYTFLGVDPVTLRQTFVTGLEEAALAAYDNVGTFDRHFLNDIVFTEPALRLAEQHAERAPTWRYRFSITSEEGRAANDGAVHGADYPYVFGDTEGDPQTPGSGALAEQVNECWTTFAATGTPDCGVDWPRADDGALLDFTLEGPVVEDTDPWADRLDVAAQALAQAGIGSGRAGERTGEGD